jgi:hypothetical protein
VSFDIRADNEHYIDLAETELWMTLALTTSPLGDTVETEFKDIAVVNNLMHSIFNQVQISVGNIEIENTNRFVNFLF